jgi:hypothetical protein
MVAMLKEAAMVMAGMALASAASAQDIPNLKGTWTGDAPVIVAGASLHLPAGASNTQPAGTYRLGNQMMTYTIEGQDGRRFWGKLSSPRATERLIGSFSVDGQRFYAIDDDGYIDGVVVGANRIDVCYREAYSDRGVVACETLQRK